MNRITFIVFMGYAIITGIMVPYSVDRFLWGMSGISVFYDVSAKAFITTVLSLIVFYFNNTTLISNNWIKSIEKNEELKRENLLAKYEALKNQVNPHFLFNILNTLSSVVEQKPELATRFIKKLSDIYRYVLEQSDKELVSIDNEMKFVEDYIYLSKLRFGEALIFSANIKMDDSFLVVPLGLQSLVENAVKHNIISDDKPLTIEISMEDGYVVVKNNIQPKNTIVSDKKPMGLENLKKRCSYHTVLSLEVIQSEHEFIVKLPIIKSL
jgi:LytS/YehU family sensor histidine kinase